MIVRLLLLLVAIILGTILAFFAVAILQDWILPVSCVVLLVVIGGYLIWIRQGGLKKDRR